MPIEKYIRAGKVIKYDSFLIKNRFAFCIDYDKDEQIVYRGFFDLKCIPKDVFFSFAKIKDVFDYSNKLSVFDECAIKFTYRCHKLLKKHKKVKEFINDLYKKSGLLDVNKIR